MTASEATQPRREAIVLAGGLGTRLASVLPDQQKVTARIGDTPFIVRLIRWLGQAGFDTVVLAAGHRAQDVQALAMGHAAGSPRVTVSIEPHPLGTGGAARLGAPLTGADQVLVLNGDSIAEIDLDALYRFHRECRAAATLALVPSSEPGRYGRVEIAADGAVTSFEEKPNASAGPSWISAGIYLFARHALFAVPEGGAVSLEREVFPNMIGKGLFGRRFQARFIDIGTPQSLAAAGSFFGVAQA